MGWVDKVPRAGNLYIGGSVTKVLNPLGQHCGLTNVRSFPCRLYALYQTEEIKAANVTHVVSVINLPLNAELFKPFQHLVIDAEDDEDENLLQYFAESNRFIEEGLEKGGGVFVHW
jgi:dual specificity phosphatase 12